MKRENGFLNITFNESFDDLVSDGTISVLNRPKTAFYLPKSKLFFKEERNVYHELVGSKIAELLNIKHAKYDLARIKIDDYVYSGVISDDFREEGYDKVNFSKIIPNYMSLENIWNSLEQYFKNYNNKDEIIKNIMNDMSTYFLFDLLIGNIDNGKFNYEIMLNDTDAKCCPYFDFEEAFYFSTTRFTVSDGCDYLALNNLREFLNVSSSEYVDRFNQMYNTLTPDKLEEIFKEVEKDIECDLPENFKNILFLAYSRHYENICKLLIEISIKK